VWRLMIRASAGPLIRERLACDSESPGVQARSSASSANSAPIPMSDAMSWHSRRFPLWMSTTISCPTMQDVKFTKVSIEVVANSSAGNGAAPSTNCDCDEIVMLHTSRVESCACCQRPCPRNASCP
jgi:hypothetical protein